jgi:hypothetical protein
MDHCQPFHAMNNPQSFEQLTIVHGRPDILREASECLES